MTFVTALTLVLVGSNVFAAETETNAEAVADATGKFIDWLKCLDMDAIKGLGAGIIAYLSANFLVIVGLVIKIVLDGSKKAKESKFYQELTAKMDETHKKQLQDLTDKFTKQVESINTAVVEEIKRQNNEERVATKESIAKMKGALDSINIELDK